MNLALPWRQDPSDPSLVRDAQNRPVVDCYSGEGSQAVGLRRAAFVVRAANATPEAAAAMERAEVAR